MQFGGLGKEGLGPRHIPGSAEAHIHQIDRLINAPIQVTPLTLHLDTRFIDMPDLADLAFALGSQLVDKMG